jgi:ankyrin repeat protein
MAGHPGYGASAAAPGSPPVNQPVAASVASPTSDDVIYATRYVSGTFNFTPNGAWLSEDGSKAAFFIGALPIPGIGTDSSTLMVKDVSTDAIVWQKPILTIEENLPNESPTLLQRLARTRLVEAGNEIPWKKWIPMDGTVLPQLLTICSIKKPIRRVTNFRGLRITYQEPVLEVERGEKRLIKIRRPPWRSDHISEEHFPAWLYNVYLDQSEQVMLIGLGLNYCGDDLWPGIPLDLHVVQLPIHNKISNQKRIHSVTESVQVRVGFESKKDPYNSLYVQGVPAISQDGTRVLLGYVEEDREHKYGNLRIESRQVDGNKPDWTASILEPGEASSINSPEEGLTLSQRVKMRIVESNAKLAQDRWTTMKAIIPDKTVGADCAVPEDQTVSFSDLAVGLRKGHLTLKKSTSGSVVSETNLFSLLQDEPVSCSGSERMFIDTAYLDSELRALVLRLGFCETPGCPAPAESFLALRLSGSIEQKESKTSLGTKSTKGDLFDAAREGDVARVKSIIAAKVDVNAKNKKGKTALMWASMNGHVEVVKALLDAKADVNAKDNSIFGQTALVWAAMEGHVEVVKLILDAKADVNAKNLLGWTALMYAARDGNVALTKTLLTAKADVNTKDKYGIWALLRAAAGGHTEVVKLLNEAGAKGFGEEDLFKAVSERKLAQVKSLIAAKVDVNAKDKDGLTVLMRASNVVVKALLEAKADVNAKDKNGETALMWASGDGTIEVVKALLDAKADVNAKNKDGRTALMCASANGNIEVVKALLDAKVDVTAEDNDGETALTYAAVRNNIEVVKLLKEAGAKK